MIGGVLAAILVTWLVYTVGCSAADISTINETDLTTIEGSAEETSNWSNDIPPLLTSSDVDILRSESRKTVSKRATSVFYNGYLERKFFSIFSYSKPIIPPTAVIPFNRPLQRGNNIPQLQYIALWAPRGQPPHWGIVGLNADGKLDGTFVKDRRIYNLSSTDMQNTPVRLLKYVGSETDNNFRFSWTKAIDVDMATVVSEKEYGLCHPRMAPAVLQEHGYEYLGEADIDNRVMYYVEHNYVNTVQGSIFTNNVYLLTKQQCECSCPLMVY